MKQPENEMTVEVRTEIVSRRSRICSCLFIFCALQFQGGELGLPVCCKEALQQETLLP